MYNYKDLLKLGVDNSSENLSKKLYYASIILSQHVVSSRSDKSTNIGIYHESMKLAIEIYNGKFEELLPNGYSSDFFSFDKKPIVNSDNETLILWKSLGNSQVVKELSEFTLDAYSDDLWSKLAHYTREPEKYLNPKVWSVITKPDIDNVDREYIVSILEEHYSSTKNNHHRIWDYDKLYTAILLSNSKAIDSTFLNDKGSNFIRIIMVLMIIVSKYITVHDLFLLFDFNIALSNLKNNQRPVLWINNIVSLTWYRLAQGFYSYSYNKSPIVNEYLVTNYSFNKDYIVFFLKAMGDFCAFNSDTSYKFLADELSTKLKNNFTELVKTKEISIPIIIFLQDITSRNNANHYKLLPKGNPKGNDHIVSISFYYSNFKEYMQSNNRPKVIGLVSNILDSQSRKNSHYEFTWASMDKIITDSHSEIEYLNLQVDGLRLSQLELKKIEDSKCKQTKEQLKYQAISDNYRAIHNDLNNKIMDLLNETNEYINNFITLNSYKGCNEEDVEGKGGIIYSIRGISDSMINLHTVLYCNYSSGDNINYNLFLFGYLQSVYEFYNLLFNKWLDLVNNTNLASDYCHKISVKVATIFPYECKSETINVYYNYFYNKFNQQSKEVNNYTSSSLDLLNIDSHLSAIISPLVSIFEVIKAQLCTDKSRFASSVLYEFEKSLLDILEKITNKFNKNTLQAISDNSICSYTNNSSKPSLSI